MDDFLFRNDMNFSLDKKIFEYKNTFFFPEEQQKKKLKNQSVLQVRVNCNLSEVLLKGYLERDCTLNWLGI